MFAYWLLDLKQHDHMFRIFTYLHGTLRALELSMLEFQKEAPYNVEGFISALCEVHVDDLTLFNFFIQDEEHQYDLIACQNHFGLLGIDSKHL